MLQRSKLDLRSATKQELLSVGGFLGAGDQPARFSSGGRN